MLSGLPRPKAAILIVDDDPGAQALLAERLRALGGWEVEVAAALDAHAAIATLKERFFDLVFLDYHLPDSDGLSVLSQIRQLHPKIVTVLMSAAGSEKIATEAMKRGAMDYLTRDDLSQADLQQILGRAAELQALQSENMELQQVNTMKDEFIASISHELRTPLAVILGYAKTLEDEEFGALTPVQKNAAAVIRTRGEQLLQMVNRLLAFKESARRPQPVLLKPLELTSLLDKLLEQQARSLGPDAALLERSLPEEPLWVLADSERLQDVLRNLLSNAFKFSTHKTPVSVSLEKRNENEAWIRVRDQGRGIPQEALAHLFDGFFHSEKELTRHAPGLGLGLVMSRQVVELHGGRIWLESPGVGRGSTAYIILPLSSPDTPKMRVEPSAPLGKKQVLVVEDNPGMLEMLRLFFTGFSENIALTTTHSGQEALERLYQTRYDLLLLDLLLPDLSGLDVLERIGRLPKEKRVPTLVITGHREAAQDALRQGAKDILIKPFYKKEFMDKVLQLLGADRREKPR